jgi:hypothetical protein
VIAIESLTKRYGKVVAVDGLTFGVRSGSISLQGLGIRLSGATGDDAGYELFPLGVAALVYLGYACAFLAATAAVVTRRDVT